MRSRWVMGIFAALGGCATAPAQPAGPAHISAAFETAPTVRAAANTAVLALSGTPRIVASGADGGIEIYDVTGARTGAVQAGNVAGVDIRYNIPLGSRMAAIVAALNVTGDQLRLYEWTDGALVDVTARTIPLGIAGESLCLYRSARDGALYAYAVGRGGEIDQWQVFDNGAGKLDARLARRLHVASEASYCTSDDAHGDLYVAEQAVGVWHFPADAEAIPEPTLIDAVRLGHIAGETGGVAIYDGGAIANYLVVSNAGANAFNLYDRNADHRFVGTFGTADSSATDAVQAAGGLFATSFAFDPRFPQGALIAADDENDGGANYKLISWTDVANALHLGAAEPHDPRAVPTSTLVTVQATVETAPVETPGDAADDPAIWVDPRDPAQSLVIATQKKSGLYVYDLSGRALQFLPDGRMNNVDLRDNFTLGGRAVSLVTASNRTNNTIAIYRVDAATHRLVEAANGPQPTALADSYGLCMYRSIRSGDTFVFINDTEGHMKQWRLVDAGNGRVRADLVRTFAFDSQTEGCVADDANGALYVNEEDVGLWRMSAEPDGGDAKTMVARIADNPALKDDLEGMGIYDLGGGRGYIVLSSQGNDTYAVFRREGDNAYVGSFAVTPNGARGIDGASETDGLDVTSAALGPAFPHGAFVTQDGRNISPPDNQNYKLVPWETIAARLHLEQR